MEAWTIGRLLETAARYLKDKGSSSARLDAELLLADVLKLERIGLYTQYDRPLSPEEVAEYRGLIARRGAHEPVAYIRGKAYFRHLCLAVRPGVLIPRPETEELVEVALEVLRRRPAWRYLSGEAGMPASAKAPPTVADVGTGSGAIALSLAHEAGVRVLALDASREALTVAAANAAALGVNDLATFRETDLLTGIADSTLELIVSNPPYVRSGDILGLAPDVRSFEPLAALDGGPDGLDVYRRLVPEAARALRPGGTLLLEVGDGQAAAVSELARTAGFALVVVHKDMSWKDRIVEATLAGAFKLTPVELHGAAAQALRRALDAGAVIGLPTDTVYGLAARWDSAPGVRRLFAAKQRSGDSPLAVLFSSVQAIRDALPDLDAATVHVLEELLPGPYTFVVATQAPRPELVGAPGSLGVRVPDHPGVLALLALAKAPLAATSANLTGLPAPAAADEVDPLVLASCSVAIVPEPGSVAAGIASTVVDLRPLSDGGTALVLREGAIAAAEVLRLIRACLE